MTFSQARQPWLHDRLIAVRGNVTAVSAADASFGEAGTGLLVDDRLILRRWHLELDGEQPVPVQGNAFGACTAIWSVARNLGDHGPDPTVEVHLERRMIDGGMQDVIRLISRAAEPVTATMTVTLAGSGAELSDVKSGLPAPSGPAVTLVADGAAWRDERHRVTVAATPAPARLEQPEADMLAVSWQVDLAASRPQEFTLTTLTERAGASGFDADPGEDRVDWSAVAVRAGDARLTSLVATGLEDLRCLLLTDPQAPGDVFAAAGTPWYLTLFGRDSLWAARMMLPFDLALAHGTLRVLARRQGRVSDPETAEEPGKILHEVRRGGYVDSVHEMSLPPLYYGTVDATALWAIVLHDAWRHGLAPDRVRELLPHLEAAMGWLRGAADNELGVLRYVDSSGHGLANQGWKDSGDSMRDRHGVIAPAPIALVEAQAYAVEAARGAADLYEAFGVAGAAQLRDWAQERRQVIAEKYWVRDEAGPYLAMALDGTGAPVDGIGSNMGHVLGTGALSEAEAQSVVGRLTSPDLLGEFGIGTLSRSNPAYNPIGYHTGSVWTHDTAIVLLGMVREGRSREGEAIARGLVDAAVPFGYRVPELFAGDSVAGRPAPYPASCRPQAWAAASAVSVVVATLGLTVDVPARTVALRPMRPSPFGRLRVEGLVFGETRFAVELDEAGVATVSGLPVDVAVTMA